MKGSALVVCPPKVTVKVPPKQSEVEAAFVHDESRKGLVAVAVGAVPVRLVALILMGNPLRWIG